MPRCLKTKPQSGGGGWTRTNDLGIMSPSGEIEGKEDKRLSSAKSSKVLQNPQQNSNKTATKNDDYAGHDLGGFQFNANRCFQVHKRVLIRCENLLRYSTFQQLTSRTF
jgi:hypothetical protein